MRHLLPALLSAVLLAGCAGRDDTAWRRINTDSFAAGDDALLADAEREALHLVAERATQALSRFGAYNIAPLTLSLPPESATVVAGLRTYGLGRLPVAVENDLNRAAEIAAGNAGPLLRQVISELSLHDARGLRGGSEPVLVGELRRQALERLRPGYEALVRSALEKSGYRDSLGIMVREFNAIPVLSDVDMPDYTAWASERALEGLLLRMEAEERELRRDPRARASERLQRLFSPPTPAE